MPIGVQSRNSWDGSRRLERKKTLSPSLSCITTPIWIQFRNLLDALCISPYFQFTGRLSNIVVYVSSLLEVFVYHFTFCRAGYFSGFV